MASIYDRGAALAVKLLAPDRMGQGTIELVRYTPGADPDNEWDPPTAPTRTVTPLNGAARGVAKELIGMPVDNGGQVVATDLMVIVAPWGGQIDPADVLEVDGTPVTILSVSNIPAAGTVCAVRLIVRR